MSFFVSDVITILRQRFVGQEGDGLGCCRVPRESPRGSWVAFRESPQFPEYACAFACWSGASFGSSPGQAGGPSRAPQATCAADRLYGRPDQVHVLILRLCGGVTVVHFWQVLVGCLDTRHKARGLCFSSFCVYDNHPFWISDSVGLGWALRISISNEFPGDTDAIGQRTTAEKPLLHSVTQEIMWPMYLLLVPTFLGKKKLGGNQEEETLNWLHRNLLFAWFCIVKQISMSLMMSVFQIRES